MDRSVVQGEYRGYRERWGQKEVERETKREKHAQTDRQTELAETYTERNRHFDITSKEIEAGK